MATLEVELNAEKIAAARAQLESMVQQFGFVEPDRGNLEDPSIIWRHSKPDYSVANLAFFNGKTQNHAAGSLEMIVENLVKTWEMEASHKKDIEQWTTIASPEYTFQTNGGRVFTGREASIVGNYNALLDGVTNKELYDSSVEDFDSSHAKFRTIFPGGFPWELLSVFSGPPKVAFSWRHWAHATGTYKGNEAKGDLVELYGFLIATVNESLKITSLEVFYKPQEFLEALEGKRPFSDLARGGSVVGTGCPFMASAAVLVICVQTLNQHLQCVQV